MFCDELKIKVIGGKGGNGCVSFRREKFVPRGGPNGGDGGKGGNITFEINDNLNTLGHLVGKKIFTAEDGGNGMGKNMHGKNGENLIIKVPPGTIIYDKNRQQLADLGQKMTKFTIVRGGSGGLGNARFVTSQNQAPRFAEKGEPGEEKEIIMELKMIADVGIIGLPSAGKSTLISVISNARPKIANYPFTTLIPNLGVVNMKNFGGSAEQSFMIADIPGLIEGASQGKGLGIKFLKHIARTKILLHLIDPTQQDPLKNYNTIIGELQKYDDKIAQKEEIIVFNKTDIISQPDLQKLRKKFQKKLPQKDIFEISALQKLGLKTLLFTIVKKIQEESLKKTISSPPKVKIFTPKPEVDIKIVKIIVKKNYRIFKISSPKIEKILIKTDIHNPEGLERIYKYLDKFGIQKMINKKGANYGDFIKILDQKIAYRK